MKLKETIAEIVIFCIFVNPPLRGEINIPVQKNYKNKNKKTNQRRDYGKTILNMSL